MLYLIKLQNNQISLSEYDSDIKTFLQVKKNGEVWQEFQEKNFWQWFKKKIEYDNEALSFAIVSDTSTFTLDKSIQLAKINFANNHQVIHQLLLSEIYTNTKLFFIPDFNYVTPKKQIQPPAEKKIQKESLSEYYTNKTKLYRDL